MAMIGFGVVLSGRGRCPCPTYVGAVGAVIPVGRASGARPDDTGPPAGPLGLPAPGTQKAPRHVPGGLIVDLVAGAGFEPTTFRL